MNQTILGITIACVSSLPAFWYMALDLKARARRQQAFTRIPANGRD